MSLLVIEALLLPSEPDESRYTARIADTTPPASRTQLRTWFGQSFGFVDGSWELIVRRLKLRRAANVRPVPARHKSSTSLFGLDEPTIDPEAGRRRGACIVRNGPHIYYRK
jgi:hypothetical protein